MLTHLKQRVLSRVSNRQGQTAIILIVIIAIALVIYAASLNWGRITQIKTLTTIASNTATANMTSIVSSYGEQQLQVNLGGNPLYCKRTNFLVLIVVIIIVIVVTILTWGAGTAPLLILAIQIISVVAITLSIAALVINLVVIQPGLTKLWNKMQANLETMEDQVVENGIMTGAQSVVTDQIQVSDHFDMNTNGLWVDELGISNSGSADTISRFSYYYTMRLRQLQGVKIPEVNIFTTELKEMLFNNPYAKVGSACNVAQPITCQDPDSFGLFDPLCSKGSRTPSPWCNPCCQPEKDADGKQLRPKSCASTAPGDVEVACKGTNWGAYPSPPYLYQYDPFYENDQNNATFLSFREMLGVDDENKFYKKKLTALPFSQIVETPTPTFRQEDATGFQTTAPIDPKKGIYPFFWNMSSFSLAAPSLINPAIKKTDNVVMLTADPANCAIATGPTATACPSTSCPNRFKTDECQCALVNWEKDTTNPKGFWWKSGSDQFCSAKYPYNDCSSSVKSGGCTAGTWDGNPANIPVCGCEISSQKEEWREDPIDNLTYGLTQLIGWANAITNKKLPDLYKTFVDWYPSAAYWIAPKCKPEWNCDAELQGDPVRCSMCNKELNDGLLIMWRDQMANWLDLLDEWLYKENFAVTDINGNNAWCLPPDQSVLPIVEKTALLSARAVAAVPAKLDRDGQAIVVVPPGLAVLDDTTAVPAVFGTLSDTIACLNFNKDNVTKFTNCKNECAAYSAIVAPTAANITKAADNCLNLPRSAVPTFDRTATDASVDPAYRNAQQFQDCLSSTCKDSTGAVLPVCLNLPAIIPPPAVPVVQNCTGWPGTPTTPNAFYDYVKAQRDAQFKLSTVCRPLPAPQTFKANIQASIDASTAGSTTVPPSDQITNFVNRLDYLTKLKAQAESTRSVFLLGYNKFKDFLRPCSLNGTLGDPADCVNCGLTDDPSTAVNKLEACLTSTCTDPSKPAGNILPVCSPLTAYGVTVTANCTNWPNNPFYFDVQNQRNIAAKDPVLGTRPAAKLMCARMNYTSRSSALSNFVIYGWQSPKAVANRANNNQTPYWHIIRVEAFAPRRCFNQCGTNEFPKVDTYTKWKFGFFGPDQFRCYELINTEGTIITRVTRYDEEHDNGFAKFANQQKIWNVQSNNPGAPVNTGSPAQLATDCAPPDPYLDKTSLATQATLRGAFMINNLPEKESAYTSGEKTRFRRCFDNASLLLNRGIQTTTCAYYYLDRSINHMSLKFTKCDPAKVNQAVLCAAGQGAGCPSN